MSESGIEHNDRSIVEEGDYVGSSTAAETVTKLSAELSAVRAKLTEAQRERSEARALVASGAYNAAFDAGSSMWTYTVALCVERMLVAEATCAQLVRAGSEAKQRQLAAEAALSAAIARAETAEAERDKARTVMWTVSGGTFRWGDHVRRKNATSWQGRVVGFYRTSLASEGYVVESEREPGSVQMCPVTALDIARDHS
jgi:hypothetical protein